MPPSIADYRRGRSRRPEPDPASQGATGTRISLLIDKHPANTAILRRLHPDIRVIEANLARADDWQDAVAGCDVVVCCSRADWRN